MEALFPSLEAAVFEAADSLECIALFAGGDRAKLRVLVLAFDFPVVAALEVSAAAAAAPLVFLLIILFGELLRCKNGLFCTVPPLGAAFSRFFSGEAFGAAACWAGVFVGRSSSRKFLVEAAEAILEAERDAAAGIGISSNSA